MKLKRLFGVAFALLGFFAFNSANAQVVVSADNALAPYQPKDYVFDVIVGQDVDKEFEVAIVPFDASAIADLNALSEPLFIEYTVNSASVYVIVQDNMFSSEVLQILSDYLKGREEYRLQNGLSQYMYNEDGDLVLNADYQPLDPSTADQDVLNAPTTAPAAALDGTQLNN